MGVRNPHDQTRKTSRKVAPKSEQCVDARIAQVLGDFGFEIEHSPNGSHYKFEYNKADLVIRLIIPFRRPIKPYYVKDAIKAIDQVKEHSGE